MNSELIRRVGGCEVPAAGVWELTPDWATVSLTIRRPLARPLRGRLRILHGTVLVADQPSRSMALVSLDAHSFDTGRPARDSYVRAELLDVDAHPTIDLIVTSLMATGVRRWEATAELRMRGQRRRISFAVSYEGLSSRGPAALLRAHTVVAPTELGLEVDRDPLRNLLARRTRCEIDVEVHARFTREVARERMHDIDEMVMLRCR